MEYLTRWAQININTEENNRMEAIKGLVVGFVGFVFFVGLVTLVFKI